MKPPSKEPQQDPPAQRDELIDSGAETSNALSPSEQIAQYIQERQAARRAAKEAKKPTPLEEAVEVGIGCGALILLILAFLFGMSLLFKGCAYLGERSKENEGRALLCNASREDLDQVKRLRDNGFASEREVRVMERKHDEACTW